VNELVRRIMDRNDPCPFCHLAADRVTRSSTHARALRNAYPVSDGHTLVVPHRHVASLWDLAPQERADLSEPALGTQLRSTVERSVGRLQSLQNHLGPKRCQPGARVLS
jgi:galactose-1-phosphate uridylyltransferase